MVVTRKLSLFILAALLMAPLAVSVEAQHDVSLDAATIVYNLYATDGYVEMADGTPVYMYGFVGGRQNQLVTYQSSFCTFDPNTWQRNCQPPVNLQAPAAAPTGGPVRGYEAVFAGHAQFPAPVIYAKVGDVVEIRLKNLGVQANPIAPNDPHSIHLHGLDVDAANDGVPETSLGAVPANLCLDGTTSDDCSANGGPAPGAGNVVVYMFSPTHPGTYMYHCHQEADIHVNMGMYGALVVYNPTDAAAGPGPGRGMGGNLFGARYDKDYILLLSEFDVRGHADEEMTYGVGNLVPPSTWDPDPYNWAMYQPQYWFINGLSFPQTIHAGFPSGYTFDDWLAAHEGYDPLITGSVSKWNPVWKTPGEKVLIRVINLGFETQPMHMHGYHGKIIGSDQRAWPWGMAPFGQGLEKNTLLVGSGETFEWLVDFGQQAFNSTYADGVTSGAYPGGVQSRYDEANQNAPASNTNTGLPAIPEGGVPGEATYVGGPEVPQYFPFHNHDDYKATNNGVYPGGMFTMLVATP